MVATQRTVGGAKSAAAARHSEDADRKDKSKGKSPLEAGPSVLAVTTFTIITTYFSFATVQYSRRLFPYYAYVTVADMIDVFAPYLIVASYFYLYFKCRESSLLSYLQDQKNNRATNYALIIECVFFSVVCMGWISAHGQHLAANSIHNLIDREYFSHKNVKSAEYKELLHALHHIVDWWDEKVSHYLWHFCIICIEAVLMWVGRGYTLTGVAQRVLVAVEATVHGIIFTGAYIEGGTYMAGFPFVVIATLAMILTHTYAKIRGSPILFFFFVSNICSTCAFAWWGYVTDWRFPEFSEVGMFFPKQ